MKLVMHSIILHMYILCNTVSLVFIENIDLYYVESPKYNNKVLFYQLFKMLPPNSLGPMFTCRKE